MDAREKNGNRTHEPSLRELTAQLDDLKEFLLAKYDSLSKVMDERDKLYTERATQGGKAIDAALKAAETLNNTIAAASEKAIIKSDINAEKWRENANEWRGAMGDRESKFASRAEVDNEFKNLRSELTSLKESRAQGAGLRTGAQDLWGYLVGAGGLIAAIVALMIAFLKH